MDQIDALMTGFQQLTGAEVGHGPSHPVTPDLTLADAVTRFLATFPFLAAYPDYVAFLQRYAGATIERPGSDQTTQHYLFILGFAPEAWHIYEEMNDASLIDANGFYIFAIVRNTHNLTGSDDAYSLAATPTHPVGVYRSIDQPSADPDQPPAYRWYSASFTAWLADVIRYDGVLA